MGWVALSLRKQSIKAAIADDELRLLQISRNIRSIQRHSGYDQSVFNSQKTQELNDAKEAYDEVRDRRPSVDSDDYAEWKEEFAEAKEDYEAQKVDINDYYDGISEELEQDAQEQQTALEDEQTQVETELQALQAELESVSEAISNDIKSSAIKFS